MDLLRKEAEESLIRYHFKPHFLYNFLNNIYSLALKKSDLTPHMIFLLSNVVKYISDSARKNSIFVIEDMAIIQNIIELYQIKFAKPIDVQLFTSGELENFKIEPLILIPLVYSSLNQANINDENGFIYITANASQFQFNFTIQYSHYPENIAPESDFEHDELLQNIYERLKLYYDSRFLFNLDAGKSNTEISLIIQS